MGNGGSVNMVPILICAKRDWKSQKEHYTVAATLSMALEQDIPVQRRACCPWWGGDTNRTDKERTKERTE